MSETGQRPALRVMSGERNGHGDQVDNRRIVKMRRGGATLGISVACDVSPKRW